MTFDSNLEAVAPALSAMSRDFLHYLDAKFSLDERCLNPEVRSAFIAAFRARPAASVLDLGAGAGASLRRLLAGPRPPRLDIVAVDLDPVLLAVARERMAAALAEAGYRLRPLADGIEAARNGETVGLRFVAADLEDYGADAAACFDVVLAHAVLDLLPVAVMAARIARWLRPGGLVYASLDYDGGTHLFPGYRDEALEQAILARYDASMELRRVWGQPSGGARSGRRLHAALLARGLDIKAFGSSDWNLTPLGGAYRGGEAAVLSYLLGLIEGEARAAGAFADEALTAWRQDRDRELARGRLGLICHQIDLLARRP